MREVKYKSGHPIRVHLSEKQAKLILLNVKIVLSLESGNSRGFGGAGDGVFLDLGPDHLGVVICGNSLWCTLLTGASFSMCIMIRQNSIF